MFILFQITLRMERIHVFLNILLRHYENTPMQHTAIFHSCENENFRLNFCDYFHRSAQNIDCGYSLEPPQ